jgi:hypothetical protein
LARPTAYSTWQATIYTGTPNGFSSGSTTIALTSGVVNLSDSRVINPFAVNEKLTILDSNTETVTVTAVSGCGATAPLGACQITAGFGFPHGPGALIISGTAGLAEAINDAAGTGGGLVVVDGAFAGTTSTITGSLTGSTSVAIWDIRTGNPVFYQWNGSSYATAGPSTPLLCSYEGTTSVPITTGSTDTAIGPSCLIPAGYANQANKTLVVKGFGNYTTGASSALALKVALCTVSGCGSGTVVKPTGCVITSGAQTNAITGQFDFECDLVTAATGASGTLMAKSADDFQIGASNAAGLTRYGDAATAVSAAVNLTTAEYVQVFFSFSASNGSDAAVLNLLTVNAAN